MPLQQLLGVRVRPERGEALEPGPPVPTPCLPGARQRLARADRTAAAVDDAAQMGFLEPGDTYVMVMAEKAVSAEGDEVEFPTMRIGQVA